MCEMETTVLLSAFAIDCNLDYVQNNEAADVAPGLSWSCHMNQGYEFIKINCMS